uniref:DNA-directed RNA polymerase subunit beta'' n=1 Tax=Cyanidium caldarium TaxID=2771 RepID=RPOC2_CYACA|nr:RNA polymerase beta'' subunit [Cyanidium caldarium]Q9TM34.1 RecName: Full=DNA-directed RNA polymerase subunit beta''; AltName: Full=PEP; AltName: Full=Plastid-encoded RNA polymerase subunit beta''; Short=RNA polymerase subunit beta'' [Cyanidium caldarium]AAF13013.1 unknown [Cyanidium caldarium]WDB00160.1 RNA polymerase beta'' subunit [Cyanidium caldarium]
MVIDKKKVKNRTPYFLNRIIEKSELREIIEVVFHKNGIAKASLIADNLKEIGFGFATKAGISISIEDLKIPPNKSRILQITNQELRKTEISFKRAEITTIEKSQKSTDTWNNASEALKDEIIKYYRLTDPLNPVYMMAFSGARGNLSQVKQLVGMRGLMADPNGQIIELPILSNFREGLNVTEYLISSYGARKGLVDTSLRTADSGYLTRRLVDVAQDIIVREIDCKTNNGITFSNIQNNEKIIIPLYKRLIGRILADDVKNPITPQVNIASKNTLITGNLIKEFKKNNIQKIKLRSPLTCQSYRSICQKCYGASLSDGKLVDIGEAIGIIAAQSIGEPGTQLTMRTFHTGGVFTAEFSKPIKTLFEGVIKYPSNLKFHHVRTRHGDDAIIIEKSATFDIRTTQSERKITLETGTTLLVKDNSFIKKNQVIAETSTSGRLITEKSTKDLISNSAGEIYFSDITIEERVDRHGNLTKISKQHGLIWILSGEVYNFPMGANLVVQNSFEVNKGCLLAKALIKSRHSGISRIRCAANYYAIDIILGTVTIRNANLYKDSKLFNNNYLLKTSNKKNFVVKALVGQKLSHSDIIAELIDDQYLTNTGGIVKYVNLKLAKTHKDDSEYTLSGIGYIFFIPQETHQINKDASILLANSGDYVNKNTEIAKGVFCKCSGLLEIIKSNNIIKEIIIKPGVVYPVSNNLSTFTNKIFYPGEKIIDNIVTNKIVYVEHIKLINKSCILIRPVNQYKVSNTESLFDFVTKGENKDLISLKVVNKSFFKDGEVIKSVKGVSLVNIQLIFYTKPSATAVTTKMEFVKDLDKSTNSTSEIKLRITATETTKIKYKQQKNIISQILIKEGQYITKDFPIIETLFLSRHDGRVVIKSNFKQKNNACLIIISPSNKKEIYINKKEHKLKIGDFIRVGDHLGTNKNFKSPYSGEVLDINDKLITIRIAEPYLISPGTLIHVNHGELIRKGDYLALLVFDKIKTGDIIQGLPRIEEILEARKPRETCHLAKFDGKIYVHYNDKGESLISLESQKKEKYVYILRLNQRVLVQSGTEVTIGEPITDGLINPHEMLEIFFEYFLTQTSPIQATKASFEKIRLELLKEIQQVYQSQKIEINDKHIEVIIRQMTSKVLIQERGDTTLFPGELVTINQIEKINSAIIAVNKKEAKYKPVLLGITKASLNTDSFISAASFQETTRILTEAAIEGKVDWLKGLKENVIIGRLIPGGTGLISLDNKDSIKMRLALRHKKNFLNKTFKKKNNKFLNKTY